MNAHGEAPAPDWSLSDLSDEEVERIADECEYAATWIAKAWSQTDAATRLALAARIIREWNEGR